MVVVLWLCVCVLVCECVGVGGWVGLCVLCVCVCGWLGGQVGWWVFFSFRETSDAVACSFPKRNPFLGSVAKARGGRAGEGQSLGGIMPLTAPVVRDVLGRLKGEK